jgi:membrane protein YdbS with pleckstrin-like domain
MSRVFSPRGEGCKPVLRSSDETVFLDARRHGVVLARPLLRAFVLAALGAAAFLGGWPVSVAGGFLLAAAAGAAVAAVWTWDRTHVVLTDEKLFLVHGVVRRQAAAVHLARVGAVEVEQSLLGRLLGYGTIVAGELEIHCVARPREVYGLVARRLAPRPH